MFQLDSCILSIKLYPCVFEKWKVCGIQIYLKLSQNIKNVLEITKKLLEHRVVPNTKKAMINNTMKCIKKTI